MSAAVLFPGQGSQFPEMVDPWVGHPASAAVLREAHDVLGFDVAEVCRDAAALTSTEVVQPAMLVCDVAAFRVLEGEGLRPSAACGHSLGEFAALVAADVIDFAPALLAVRDRGEAMERACAARPGAMTALIGPSADEVGAICAEAAAGDELVVANENSPQQTVIAGAVPAVERAETRARERGHQAVRLRVAGAFHSPLMAPALGPIAAAIARLDFRAPRFTIVPNVSGEACEDPDVLEDLLCRHVVSPVRWLASMENLAKMGVETFIEAGPGDVLSRLARRCVPGSRVVTVGSPEDAAAARTVTGGGEEFTDA